MPLVSDHCVCLRKVEYSETSQILTLLGREHGIVSVVAKGAHRRTKAGSSKFDGGVDLMDLGQAVFTSDVSKDLATLCEWKLTEGHLSLRRDLRAMYLGQFALELVAALLEEHDPHPSVFDGLVNLLTQLPTSRREEASLVFTLDLIREAGLAPNLDACINCQKPIDDRQPTFFSPAKGGVVCGNCRELSPDRIAMDGSLLRLCRNLQQPDHPFRRQLPRLTRHQTDPLNRMLCAHVEHAMSKKLRMASYILSRLAAS